MSLWILVFRSYIFAQDIIWQDISRGNLNLRTVLVEPDNPKVIYIGSNDTVLKTEDGGETWRNILSIRGQNKVVNFLLFGLQDRNSLYAATGNGLYYSHNQGKSWKRIFRGKDYLERECTTLAVLPSAIYLGTKAGLFVSKDKGSSWQRQSSQIGRSQILAIAYSLREPDYIYVACPKGIFKTKNAGETWERIFVAISFENNNEQDQDRDQDEENMVSNIRYISIDLNNLDHLYLATSPGIYKSQDRGLSWELLSSYGLLSCAARFLLVSPKSSLYTVTKSGVFEYRNGRWQELSLRLPSQEIRFLAVDNQGNLYAASDMGLFKTNKEYFGEDSKDNPIALYYKDEPTINAVQQAAIKYAEVEPEKIMRWRRQAAKKAWLPQVSVGLDRNVTDLWHWEGGSTTRVDDDTLRRGKDTIEWDVSLRWDLGELIYNDDQTSIDVRSRLMVQLRDDILDEVTKLYFERIRVKIELDSIRIEDRKKRLEKELRLQELTAMLDALTGGYFSNHQYRD